MTQAKRAERDRDVDVLRLLPRAADRARSIAACGGSAALVGHRDRAARRRGTGRSATGRLAHRRSVGRALGDDLAAVDAGARPHVDHLVGGADRLLVVLDHDHRVAEVAQPPEGREQPVVVALVQADRRLVEHVEHAGQPRADLRGQPDALALAARERAAVARRGSGSRARHRSGSPAARGSPSGSGAAISLLLGGQLGRQAPRTRRPRRSIDSAVDLG